MEDFTIIVFMSEKILKCKKKNITVVSSWENAVIITCLLGMKVK